MICREFQTQFVLSFYDELTEQDRAGLEIHILECVPCSEAYASHKSIHEVIVADAADWDVPADLLHESRRALANELDRLEQKRPWWRLPTFSVVLTPMRMLESAALIAIGLAFGVYVSHQEADRNAAPVSVAETSLSAIPSNATISNLRFVNTDTNTGAVELAGEVVQPLSIHGQREDESVQKVLVSMLRDANNPGARLRAAEVLAQKSIDASVMEALVHAMVSDENAGVRLKALEGLKPFVQDAGVREAFVKSLGMDPVAGIRLAAVEALNEFSKDDTMAKAIQDVTKDDNNAAVRIRGLQFIGNRQ